MKKKFLALLLCLVMLFSLLVPGTVASDDVNADGEPVSDYYADPAADSSAENNDETAPVDDAQSPDNSDAPDVDAPADPENPVEDGSPVPSETPACTCGSTDGTHAADCPLYAPAAPDFTVLYNELMAAETLDAYDALYNALSEEDAAAFEAWLDESGLREALEAHYAELAPEEEVSDWIPAVNVTDVAPLLPPVSGRPALRAYSRVSTYAGDDTTTGKKPEGLKMSKSATLNTGGSYTIRLEAYATGSSVTTVVEKEIPTDIILVLDQSGSMADCIVCGQNSGYCYKEEGIAGKLIPAEGSSYSYYYKETYWGYTSYSNAYYCDGESQGHQRHTRGWYSSQYHNQYSAPLDDNTMLYIGIPHQIRLDALKTAVTTFANEVAKKAAGADGRLGTDDDVGHRIAMVGFGSSPGTNSRNDYDDDYGNNTEILSVNGTNSGEVGVRYKKLTDAMYKSALQRMDTIDGQGMIEKSIDALASSGATRTDLGLEMAKNILDKNPLRTDEQRNRVVIVFTDGSPTSSSGFKLDTANNAIDKANEIRAAGTTVYAVGVFSGANADDTGTRPSSDLEQKDSRIPAASNWFMQNVSSNNGTPKSPSYYLSANNSDALNNIFKSISQNIDGSASTTTLDEKAVIKDIVSDYFQLPEGATKDDIKLYTAESDGEAGKWKDEQPFTEGNVSIDGSNVSVSGFNFKENWCGTHTTTTENGQTTTFHNGKKLIIEFTVQPKSGFLGGNNVPTNGDKSGIYEDGNATEPVGTFDVPTVNVDIKDITVSGAKDVYTYLGGSITKDQLLTSDILTGATAWSNGAKLELDRASSNYGLESWQNQYVDIFVTAVDENGNEITDDTLKDLKDNTTYQLKVTIKPKTASTGEYDLMSAGIKILTPTITWKDSRIDAGHAPKYLDENFDKIEWKYGDTTIDNGWTVIGTEPTLNYAFDPVEAVVTQETPVKVTKITIGANVFESNDLSTYFAFEHTCAYTDDLTCKWETDYKGTCHFIVHLNTFDLVITKSGTEAIDENQSFVFKIVGGGVDMEVTIQGDRSVTIKGLKVGTYTVTEVESWSWRYEAKVNSQKITSENIGLNGVASVTFDNDRTFTKWLNGCAYAFNNWKTGSAVKRTSN